MKKPITNKVAKTVGIDLAKSTFHVHGENSQDEVVFRKKAEPGKTYGVYGKSAALPCWHGSMRRFPFPGKKIPGVWP